jgi:hypothetical protein
MEADTSQTFMCLAESKNTLVLLLVIPVISVKKLVHNHNIPNPTLPLLLPLYSQSSSVPYQREVFG